MVLLLVLLLAVEAQAQVLRLAPRPVLCCGSLPRRLLPWWKRLPRDPRFRRGELPRRHLALAGVRQQLQQAREMLAEAVPASEKIV